MIGAARYVAMEKTSAAAHRTAIGVAADDPATEAFLRCFGFVLWLLAVPFADGLLA